MDVVSHPPAAPARAAIGVAVLLVALGAVGYVAMMSGWEQYDDEGYVLMSLHHFAGGSDLYDTTYSQYGPLFFELFGLPFRALGVAPGHDAARILTLVFWLAASSCVGVLTWRFAGRALSWGVVGAVLSFVVLLPITAEPLHPGGFLVMVMAALAVVCVMTGESRRYLVAGVLVAALGLTKINIGGLAAFAIVLAETIAYTPRTAAQRHARAAVIAVCCAVPLVLLASSADVPEWRWLGIGVTASLAALAIVAPRGDGDPVRAIGQLTLGALGLTAIVLAIIVAAGTSLRGLVDGILLEPLALSEAFTVVPEFDLASLLVALMVLAFVVYVQRSGEPVVPPAVDVIVGLVAFVALIGDSVLPLDSPFLAPLLAPVVLLAGEREARREGILPVSCLAVFGALQAYPVAGSQVAFGTFLTVVPAVLILRRGLAAIVPRPAVAPTAALVVAGALFLQQFVPQLADYRSYEALDTPGARLMRLAPGERDDLRGVLEDLRGCRTVVSFPGVLSLNLWSEVAPPSQEYAGAWMYLLEMPQQERIVRQLDNSRAVCLVQVPELLSFWKRGRPIPDRPLVRWVERAEGPTTRHGPYIVTHVS